MKWMSAAQAMQDPRGGLALVPCWWREGPRWVLREPTGGDVAIVVAHPRGWWCGMWPDGRSICQEATAEQCRAAVDAAVFQP